MSVVDKAVYVFPTLRDLAGGDHVARTSAESCVGGGGTALFGWDLSLGGISIETDGAGTRARTDVSWRLYHARDFRVAGSAESVGESQHDRLRSMVESCARRGYGGAGSLHSERSRTLADRRGCVWSHRCSSGCAGSGKAVRRAGIGGVALRIIVRGAGLPDRCARLVSRDRRPKAIR